VLRSARQAGDGKRLHRGADPWWLEPAGAHGHSRGNADPGYRDQPLRRRVRRAEAEASSRADQ